MSSIIPKTPCTREAETTICLCKHCKSLAQLEEMRAEVGQIIADICLRYSVAEHLIRSRVRTQKVARCRGEIAWELRQRNLSFPKIGRILNRDHATIMHAISRHEAIRAERARLHEEARIRLEAAHSASLAQQSVVLSRLATLAQGFAEHELRRMRLAARKAA
jgi:predicted house-cleaning noncanonical NTP pyrophosphatase (MazG superfamily)